MSWQLLNTFVTLKLESLPASAAAPARAGHLRTRSDPPPRVRSKQQWKLRHSGSHRAIDILVALRNLSMAPIITCHNALTLYILT